MLAVDIGNTTTRVAAFAGETIRARRAFPTRGLDAARLAPALDELAAAADARMLWVASVAPAANAVVDSAAERAGLGRRFIRSGVDFIIENTLATPRTTGVDRLLSAMAAGRRHFAGADGRRGYVVVQCGSAATVDVVDRGGVFRGGYILPGPTMWLSTLASAAQLPDLSRESPDWSAVEPGDNTRDAIMHGMAAALPLAVSSAAMAIHVALGDDGDGGPLPAAITGGWGAVVSAILDDGHVLDPDLLLHGIRYFAETAP